MRYFVANSSYSEGLPSPVVMDSTVSDLLAIDFSTWTRALNRNNKASQFLLRCLYVIAELCRIHRFLSGFKSKLLLKCVVSHIMKLYSYHFCRYKMERQSVLIRPNEYEHFKIF